MGRPVARGSSASQPGGVDVVKVTGLDTVPGVNTCSSCFFLLCGIVSKSAFRPRLAASDTDLAPAQTGGELIPAVLTKQRHEGTLERIDIDKVIQSQHHRYRVL